MNTNDISFISLTYLTAFIIPILFLLNRFKIKLVKSSIISIARMVVQLSLVGVYLQYIFALDNPYVNIAYLFLMIATACFTIGKSVNIKISRIFFIVLVAISLPLLTVLLFFGRILIELDNPLEAMYLIPISGMLLGNALRTNIISLNSFFKIFKKNEDEYLYSLALGANKYEALSPYIKEGLTSAISPIIASLATLGIVSLPGMMTGQILGGSLPITAIKYQIAIMLTAFTCNFFSSLISLYMVSRYFFDDYHLLDSKVFTTKIY